MNTNIKVLRFMAFAMLTASIACLFLGIYFYIKKDEYLKTCRLITCKISSIDEFVKGTAVLKLDEVNGNYKPVYYKVTYDPSEEELDYKVGETYDVYYDSKNPNDSEIKGLWHNFETTMIFIMIGIWLMIDCPVMLFVARLQLRRKQTALDNLRSEVVSE